MRPFECMQTDIVALCGDRRGCIRCGWPAKPHTYSNTHRLCRMKSSCGLTDGICNDQRWYNISTYITEEYIYMNMMKFMRISMYILYGLTNTLLQEIAARTQRCNGHCLSSRFISCSLLWSSLFLLLLLLQRLNVTFSTITFCFCSWSLLLLSSLWLYIPTWYM